MERLQFINNYRDEEQYRKSFFELANDVFGLNFEKWFENGFWGESYIPFSYVYENKVIANVSVNILVVIIEGKQYNAVQIGTVMTHPDYRNKGLSKRLINKVLAEYKNTYDFMYLFANDSVLDFYPKFGFERVEEYQYSTNFLCNLKSKKELRKLDITNSNDLHFIYRLANDRIPVSQRFATVNAHGIFMYYCLNVFCEDIYYHDSEEAMVIFQKDENQIDIFDIISRKPVNVNNILNDISCVGTNKIVFHYTPDYEGLLFERNPLKSSGILFVKTTGPNYFPKQVKHPITSEA